MQSHTEPLNLETEFINQVKDSFSRSDFSETGILGRLNCKDSVHISPREMPRLLRLTASKTPLDTLIRLFILGQTVDTGDTRQAVEPMTLDAWSQGGLVKVDGSLVSAPLRIVPSQGFLLAFDPPTRHTTREAQPDHVHGVGRLSKDLLNVTVRSNVDRALDLGTGCGIQGLLMSRHSRRVISTDVNPRALNIASFNAALNGIENIEFRQGSIFEPVAGDHFDLITMNPPFAISPDQRFRFRDGGMEDDDFVKTIVEEGPAYLVEGGLFQLTAQWAHFRGIEWQNRLATWFRNSGCDVWVICLATQSTETYAANWIMETEKHDSAGYARRWEEWMDHYTRKDIESASTGIINMRRVSGRTNLCWFHEDADEVDEFAGAAVANGFKLKDFLTDTTDDTLMNLPLQVVPEIRIAQLSRSKGEGWVSEKTRLQHHKGIHYHGNLDRNMMALIGRCNGQRPLSKLIDELAEHINIETDKVTASVLQIIRELIERGFLLPPGLI